MFETVAFVIDGLKNPILSRKVLKKFKLIPEEFPFIQVNQIKQKFQTPIVKLTAQRSRSRSSSSTRKPFYFKLKERKDKNVGQRNPCGRQNAINRGKIQKSKFDKTMEKENLSHITKEKTTKKENIAIYDTVMNCMQVYASN